MSTAILASNTQAFSKLLKDRAGSLKLAAANSVDPNRVRQILLASVSKTPALQRCSIDSIFQASIHAVELGFYPGSVDGKAYLVPYGNVATLIVGYKGLIDLAYRSGQIKSIQAKVVYDGDTFSYRFGLEQNLEHVPCGNVDPATIKHGYAIVHLLSGGVLFDVMTKDEIDSVRRRSKASGSGPWVTDYAEMAKKTVLRRVLKLAPFSIEMQKAMALDDYADTGDTSILAEYIDVIEEDETPTKTKTDAIADRLGGKESSLKSYGFSEIELRDFQALADSVGKNLEEAAAKCEPKTAEALVALLNGGDE